MSDKALSNAEAKRNQLLDRKKALSAELSDLDGQLDQIERFIAAWHQFASGDTESAVDNFTLLSPSQNQNKPETSKKPSRNSKKEVVADAARKIIFQRGEPISRADLYEALMGYGLTIEGGDPDMVLSTMLWRMKHQVVRLRTGGYWLADKDWPAAGYFPSLMNEIQRGG